MEFFSASHFVANYRHGAINLLLFHILHLVDRYSCRDETTWYVEANRQLLRITTQVLAKSFIFVFNNYLLQLKVISEYEEITTYLTHVPFNIRQYSIQEPP